ncbi:MAG: amidohydrolase family protein, partial [Myxococcota bacterium]
MRRVLPLILVAGATALALYLQPDVPARQGRTPADLIIERARLADGTLVSVALADGRVLASGTTFDFASAFDAKETIEAAGGTLVGGFHDGHAHVLTGGLGLSALQLGGAQSVDEVLERVRVWASDHPDLEWIRGRGWVYSMFDGGFPDRTLLDGAVSDRPVILDAFDGHAIWANSAAIRKAGVSGDTPDPIAGEILRDRAGGASGVFLESAQKILVDAAPPFSFQTRLDAIGAALQFALARGVTAIDDMVYRDVAERVRIYRTLEMEGRLPLAVRVFPVVTAETQAA